MKCLPARLLILLSLLIFLLSLPPSAQALNSCSVNISPNEPEANVAVEINIAITNTSSTPIKWFQIWKPHEGTQFGSAILYPAWINTEWTTDYLTYVWNGSDAINPGATFAPRITLHIGNILGASGTWWIAASDQTNGSEAVQCSGNISFNVTGINDATAPVISSLQVTDITATSLKIKWQTNEPATSWVGYDVNANYDTYPFSHSSNTLKTSHELTLTQGLAPLTTYYYLIRSTDAAGNTGQAGEYSFTTAALGATQPPQIFTVYAPTPTPTPNSSSGKVVTPTPLPPTPEPRPAPNRDQIPPEIHFTGPTDFPVLTEPQTITGTVSDNQLVVKVEYSTDNGDNWLPVDQGSRPNSARSPFSFTPQLIKDGNYLIRVRATDASGNQTISTPITLIIDRYPPLIGTGVLISGGQYHTPREDGSFLSLAGLQHEILLPAIGGATSLFIRVTRSTGSDGALDGATTDFPLEKHSRAGLWRGHLNFPQSGQYSLTAYSKDGAGNKAQRQLQTIDVLPPGKVTGSGQPISGAELNLYTYNSLTGRFIIWSGDAFGQSLPLSTNQTGEYALYLPPGKYYLSIKAAGFRPARTPIFTLDADTFINADFTLTPLPRLLSFIPTSLLGSNRLKLVLSQPELNRHPDKAIGKPLPAFSLPTNDGLFYSAALRGKPSVLAFTATWYPQTSRLINLLDQINTGGDYLTHVILVQERRLEASLFSRRGRYQLDVLADETGQVSDLVGVNSLPAIYILDRSGVVRHIYYSLPEADNLINKLKNYH